MAEITAEMVRDLREKTGAGMMDCKRALGETAGDLEKAVDYLRKKGISTAEKKSGRETNQGLVTSYIHAGGTLGVLVEINCETDFVAKTDAFQALIKDVAMHIAAANPLVVRREQVPEAVSAREREIFRAQAEGTGKPAQVIEKIIDGKMEKFFSETCLEEQAFVKDPDKTIKALVTETVAKLGENITIRRFARFRLGEEQR
ncbi:MAG: translation elongation factor Ts [bacterium]